jgi:hypothetical protein
LRGGIRQKIVLVRYPSSPKIFSKRLAQALHFLSLPAAVNATLVPINTSRKKSSETSNGTLPFNETQDNGTLPFNGTRLGNLTLPHDDSALEPQYRKELLKYLHHSHWIRRYYQSDIRLWSQITLDLQSGEKRGAIF